MKDSLIAAAVTLPQNGGSHSQGLSVCKQWSADIKQRLPHIGFFLSFALFLSNILKNKTLFLILCSVITSRLTILECLGPSFRCL